MLKHSQGQAGYYLKEREILKKKKSEKENEAFFWFYLKRTIQEFILKYNRLTSSQNDNSVALLKGIGIKEIGILEARML